MAPPPSPSARSPSSSSDGANASKPRSQSPCTLPSSPMATSSLQFQSQSAASTIVTTNGSSPLQLYVAIRRGRVILLTTATVLTLLLTVYTFSRGVVLTTITDTEKTLEQQNKLLDDYNSYSGNIASLFGTPVEKFVEAAVQVILLRFLTRAITAAEPTWKLRVVGGGVGLLAAYLISNGFTALNVQLRPSGLDAVISAEDLTAAFQQSHPGRSTNVTDTFPETQPRNPITNTMLRNAVLPRILNGESHCLYQSTIPDVDVSFGFIQRDWQAEVLQEALPAQQLRVSITEASNWTLLDGGTSAEMPINASLAADLYFYGMHLMGDAFNMTMN